MCTDELLSHLQFNFAKNAVFEAKKFVRNFTKLKAKTNGKENNNKT